MGVLNVSIKTPVSAKFDSRPAVSAANKGQVKTMVAAIVDLVLSGQSAAGVANTDFEVQASGTRASATYTLNAVVATNTVVINGVTLTAIASGATNVQFNVGATDTDTAANIAAAINSTGAPAGILGVVRAYSAAAVVTVECIYPGTIGNSITTTGTVTRFTVSGATMAGGVVGTLVRPAVA